MIKQVAHAGKASLTLVLASPGGYSRSGYMPMRLG